MSAWEEGAACLICVIPIACLYKWSKKSLPVLIEAWENPVDVYQNVPRDFYYRFRSDLFVGHSDLHRSLRNSLETTVIILGLYWVYAGVYWDNGKENGNYSDYITYAL